MTAEQLTIDLTWSLETVSRSLGVALDPLHLRQVVRRVTMSSEESLDPFRAFCDCAPGLRLSTSRLSLTANQVIGTQTPLPLVSVDAGQWLVVVDRHGGRARVMRPDAPDGVWLDESALASQASPRDWVAVTPAAPLEAIAGTDHHHPTPWQRFRALLRLERDDLNVTLVYAAAVGALSLATPIAVQTLVTTVAFGTLLQPIVVVALMLLAALTFAAVLRALQTRVVETLQQRLFVRTAIDLSFRLPRLKWAEVRSGGGPEAMNRFFEVMTLQKTAATLFTDGIATILQMSIGMLVLGFYHPALLALDLVLVAAASAVLVVPGRRGLETSLAESRAKYAVAAWLQELSRATTSFRGQAGTTFATERADALTRRYLDARQAHFSVVFNQTVGSLAIQVFANAALLGVGGWLVVDHQLTLGQLVAAELIVAAVTNSISKFGKLLDASYDMLTALDKLGHLVDLPTEAVEQGERLSGSGPLSLELRGVTDGARPPLSRLLPAGAKVSIDGPLPSATAEWLLGLTSPPHGQVLLNNVDTRLLAPRSLHDQVALVRSNDFFAGSIEDNLTIARATATPAEVRQALKTVGLDALGPELLKTSLGPTGFPLGRGQRLALSVARVLVARPRLVVVDNSLESVEPPLRDRLVKALSGPDAPWTLVVLAPADTALSQACTSAAWSTGGER